MIELTRSRKSTLLAATPILLGAGSVGFDGTPYRRLLEFERFGVLFTSAISAAPRSPAHGTRVVTFGGGFLLHTGLPNGGVRRVVQDHERAWGRLPIPVVAHVVAHDTRQMETLARALEACPALAAIELSLHEDATARECRELLKTYRNNCDLPVLVRLPLYEAQALGEIAQEHGADALVVAAPPRGTERDPRTQRLIGGRVYGPSLKAQALRMVGRVAQFAQVPLIGAGGVHSRQDAEDFLLAGACAVQLDSVVWVDPKGAQSIADHFAAGELTRTSAGLMPAPPPDEERDESTQTQAPAPWQED